MGRRVAAIDLNEILAEALSAPRPGRGAAEPASGASEAGDGDGVPVGTGQDTGRPHPGPGSPGREPPRLDDDADTDADTEAMIDATSALLATYGLRRWTMEDVAERAGLGRATVYRRFESRERLVRATLVRDARRFFAAVVAAVAGVRSFEDKVVEGFVVGLELVNLSPFPQLLRADPAAALSLVTSESTLRAGRRALVESYEALIGRPVPRGETLRIEAVAEALIRLGVSVLLTPGLLSSGGCLEPDRAGQPGCDELRQALTAVIGPLVSSPVTAGAAAGPPRTRSSPRR